MRILVVRHPRPIDAEGICYGQSDLDISDEALADTAAALAARLGTLGGVGPGPLGTLGSVGRWVSSPLMRCTKLADRLGVAYERDPRLLEMHFGDWEGLSWDDIDREAFDSWMADYVSTSPPGGECFQAVADRVDDLLSELSASNVETVGFITHAGVIRALLASILDIPLESTWRFSVGYGAVLVMEVGEQGYQNRLVALLP